MTRTDWARRFALGAIGAVVATFCYRSIQHAAAPRALLRAACWTWQWLPFNPAWLWPYLSMFVLLGLPWFMLARWSDVKRFAVTMLGTAAVGWIVFLVYPTACVRPDPTMQPLAYQWLIALDQSDNCLPCLHSAFSILAGWVLITRAPKFQSPYVSAALVAWVALILVSIVALRQHTDLDTLAGAILGAGGAWVFSAGNSKT